MIGIYAVIVFIATTIGAIAGLGGGVIIKPLFDFLGYHDAQTIGVFAAFAVFTMSVISLYKHKNKLAELKLHLILYISLGSFCGGYLGEKIFGWIKLAFANESLLKLVQSTLLLIVLILIVIYGIVKKRLKTYHLKNAFLIFLTGLFLGAISVFLGIGGGPLNVIFLSVLFSFEMKEVVIYSITTVFFAQLSKLTQIYFLNQFKIYDLKLILWICIFAILGGYCGTLIHQKISGAKIEKIYLLTIVFLVFITSFNIVRGVLSLWY